MYPRNLKGWEARPYDNLLDAVEAVEVIEEVEIFLRTVGDGGLNVREVNSEATLPDLGKKIINFL